LEQRGDRLAAVGVEVIGRLAVIRRETGGWKWMAVTFACMLALAYAASLLTYNVAVALGAG
jgi:ferrous iron transport protein B